MKKSYNPLKKKKLTFLEKCLKTVIFDKAFVLQERKRIRIQ